MTLQSHIKEGRWKIVRALKANRKGPLCSLRSLRITMIPVSEELFIHFFSANLDATEKCPVAMMYSQIKQYLCCHPDRLNTPTVQYFIYIICPHQFFTATVKTTSYFMLLRPTALSFCCSLVNGLIFLLAEQKWKYMMWKRNQKTSSERCLHTFLITYNCVCDRWVDAQSHTVSLLIL